MSDNVVVLEHADSLLGKVIEGENVRELIGNVRFRQGTVAVTCDRAMQYLRSNRASLDGNVSVRDDTLTMRGKRGMYYGAERAAEAFESVRLDDGTTVLTAGYGKYYVAEKRAYFRDTVTVRDSVSTLTCRELTYSRDQKRSVADGDVRIRSSQENLTIFGQHLEDDKKSGFSRMTIRPRVEQIDTSTVGRTDTMVVLSRIMELHQDTVRRMIAIDSVRMWRSELAATSGLAFFYTNLDSIILRIDPVVWYEDDQVSGDSIFIKLKERRPQTVYVRGSAFAISISDTLHPSRFNQMTGETITMRFAENKIQRIEVDQTATSLYYLYETVEDSTGKRLEPNGVNKTTGDHVIVEFVDGKSNKIRVIGGVEGQYFPENLADGREAEYSLGGFNWREDRPGAWRRAVPAGRSSPTQTLEKRTSHE
jgi:lipopolysaccharide export system protein LptA